ncbi:MAG: hypothetical protein JWM59_2442 [Verrucomicrobiales bacterium]|nr:hypothetical protein [Verrucomicrobiales bacterium]
MLAILAIMIVVLVVKWLMDMQPEVPQPSLKDSFPPCGGWCGHPRGGAEAIGGNVRDVIAAWVGVIQ